MGAGDELEPDFGGFGLCVRLESVAEDSLLVYSGAVAEG